MGKSDVGSNVTATKQLGGITGKGFMPGKSGNPRGDNLPPEVRQALRLDTLTRYERLKKLSLDAEANGDLKTAATIELALLKKQIPDLSAVEVTGEGGGPLQVAAVDVRKLNAEGLAALRVVRAQMGDGQ
jgi:hypothetical protein